MSAYWLVNWFDILKNPNLEDDFEEIKRAGFKNRKSDANFKGKDWWNAKILEIEERFGTDVLPNTTWLHPIKDENVELYDKSSEFEDGKVLSSHFYNQLVRIPLIKEPTPVRILQIAFNIGQGLATGSVKKSYKLNEFVKIGSDANAL